jgi:hypothetical protein
MKSVSMRTDCGFLAKPARHGNNTNSNRGQGDATSVDNTQEETLGLGLIQMNDEEDVYVDTLYRRLIDKHVTQDSRSQSLPNCIEKQEVGLVNNEKCDLGPFPDPPCGVNCDPTPFVCDKGTSELKFDINGSVSSDSWFKTWPETRNIINTQKLSTQNESNKQSRQQACDENRNCEPSSPVTSNVRPSTVIPLDQLLQSIPLAYSPITRQLHVLSPPAHSEPQQEISKGSRPEDGEDFLGCNPKSGSPFSSLSSLSGAELCGPSTPSNDDDSSDTTSISFVNDAHLNKNLLGAKLKQGAFSNFFTRYEDSNCIW